MRVTSTKLLVAAVAILPVCSNAMAASGGVGFQGVVSSPAACIIIVENNGTMQQNSSGSILSSQLPGGAAGSARVISFWNYDITAYAPSFWDSSPYSGQAQTDFTAYMRGQSIFGGVNFAQRNGANPYQLPFGFRSTRVFIDLDAAHQTASFPQGNYQATVVLTCD